VAQIFHSSARNTSASTTRLCTQNDSGQQPTQRVTASCHAPKNIPVDIGADRMIGGREVRALLRRIGGARKRERDAAAQRVAQLRVGRQRRLRVDIVALRIKKRVRGRRRSLFWRATRASAFDWRFGRRQCAIVDATTQIEAFSTLKKPKTYLQRCDNTIFIANTEKNSVSSSENRAFFVEQNVWLRVRVTARLPTVEQSSTSLMKHKSANKQASKVDNENNHRQ
jgi:hypothetical protein